ncbi:MAG: hypothetical protein KGS72_18335 [Cyanobacteria bacterium REEB67]|nr:hypothetical protein [Cyanobacteria bacterium REEB67]
MFGKRKPAETAVSTPPPPPEEPTTPSPWPRSYKSTARVCRSKTFKHGSDNYSHLVVIVDDPDEIGAEKIMTLTFYVSSHTALANVEEGDRLSLELHQHSEKHDWTVSKGRINFDPDKERARFESKSEPTAER